jgi:hypothetical protein
MKTIIAALTAATALTLAPTAHATTSTVRTEVYWTGTPCIDVTGGYSGVTKNVCGSSYTLNETNVQSGDLVGLDSARGNTTSLTCTLYFNGNRDFSDTTADDGVANCVRRTP